MRLKINKLAHKIFIYLNVIIILLCLLIYLIIPPQFEEYIEEEKKSSLKHLNQMLSKQSKMYLDYSTKYTPGSKGIEFYSKGIDYYNMISVMVKTELLRYFQINPDFVYCALIPKHEGKSLEPLYCNKEKMGVAEELITYKTNETVIIKKAGMLNVITPVFGKYNKEEIDEKKRGYLISGFSLKAQEEELKKIRYAIFVICLIFVPFGNLLGYILYRHITTPLKKSTEMIKNVVQGDLIGMVKSKSKDELGSLTQALNTMVKTWRQNVGKIKNVIESSNSVSSEISIAANQQEKITSKEAYSINEIAATIEELNNNSRLIHKKAGEVEERSKKLLQVSIDGQKSVNNSIENFAIIREYVKNIAKNVLNLSEEAQQIGVILKEVSSIAHQTDMLAINAGIRAAKVKERGKEFLIIAEEIRDLATQSQVSAARITSLIEDIQTSTHSTVMAMDQGIKRVEEGIKLILKAGKTIETVIINVKETADSVNEITTSSHQRFLATDQVTQSIVSINKGMKETAISSKQSLKETEALNKVNQELLQMINFYKI